MDEEKFAVNKDILEDSWVVQEERREGAVQGLHEAVQDVIQARFPEILLYAKKQMEGIEDTELLRRLIMKMSTVLTAEEALQYLFTLDNAKSKVDAVRDVRRDL